MGVKMPAFFMLSSAELFQIMFGKCGESHKLCWKNVYICTANVYEI
jgi:hypothetical protein